MKVGAGVRRLRDALALPGSVIGTALCAVSELAFLVVTTRYISLRGPLKLEAPATVISNSHPAQRQSEPLLLFLRDLNCFLPIGAAVAVVTPPTEPTDLTTDLLIRGQLPRVRVVSPDHVLDGRATPGYIATFGHELTDPRVQFANRVAFGNVYAVVRP